jgi:hypothetical protein
MIKCTEPELWTTVPKSDAPQEDVARYLTHLDRCAFHAEIERLEEERIRNVAALAASDLGGEDRDLPMAAAVREGLNELEDRRRHAFIRTLAIRVNGSEQARLDLLADNHLTLDVEEGELIGVWQPNQNNAARDLYLTSYVADPNRAAAAGKKVSSTVLEGGQRISFSLQPRGSSRVRITVAYAETQWLRALRLSWARLKQNLGFGTGEIRWSAALKVAAALLVLLAALMLPFLLFRNKAQRVNQGATVEPPSDPGPEAPHNRAVISATPAIDRNVRPRPGAPIQTSVENVRRVYVSVDKGEYNQQLRAALINQLQRSGRFTVVPREEEADALLVSETTRGASVRVQLLNRAKKSLWFTTQPTAGESLEDLSGVAARIVRALTEEAQGSQGSSTPRP